MNTIPKFPYYVHTTTITDSRAGAETCAIAGFNSRSYADDFAQTHASASADLSLAVIVTSSDLAEGVLSAYQHGKPVRLSCPCIGACIEPESHS